MNTKIIVYNKEYIHNYDALKQLCLMMNIEIILINNQMTQNKIKDLLNKEIKKEKIRIFSYYLFKCSFFTNGSNIDVVKRKYNTLFKSNCYSNKL